MQRLGDSCLRLKILTISSSTCNLPNQIRSKHNVITPPWPKYRPEDAPLRKKYLTYNVSELILDLEAEDSAYVRPYNEEIDGVPRSAWAQHTIESRSKVRRVAIFERQSKEYEAKSRSVQTDKFSAWRISDHDILSVVLANSPSARINPDTSPGSDSHTLNDIHPLRTPRASRLVQILLENNGIPDHVWNSTSKTVTYMLRSQQLAHRRRPSLEDAELFPEALHRCHSFVTFERLVTNMLQTPRGCQIVSLYNDALLSVLSKMENTTPPAEMLPFLHNLILSLESQDLPITFLLLWRAFKTSLLSQAFIPARKYLNMIHDKGHALDDVQIKEALRILVTIWQSGKPAISSRMAAHATPQLLAVYSLLTGREPWEETSRPSLNDAKTRDPSHLHNRIHVPKEYITCLAHLGAFRTMWYVWRARPDNRGVVRRQKSKPWNVKQKAADAKNREYVKAKVFANAIREAIEANSRLLEVAQASDFANASGQYEGDCQLDIESIVKSADLISQRSPPSLFLPPQISQTKIAKIFRKETISEAMSALRDYLTHVQKDRSEILEMEKGEDMGGIKGSD